MDQVQAVMELQILRAALVLLIKVTLADLAAEMAAAYTFQQVVVVQEQ